MGGEIVQLIRVVPTKTATLVRGPILVLIRHLPEARNPNEERGQRTLDERGSSVILSATLSIRLWSNRRWSMTTGRRSPTRRREPGGRGGGLGRSSQSASRAALSV